MVDLSNVSQRIINEFHKITQEDGKKGISNQEERNKIADLLSGATGNYNIEYLTQMLNEYDLNEAKQNASADVVKDIEKAKKMDGDKNSIDSDKEEAVLNAIINNTTGNYSAEDIKYAKLVKKSFGLSEETPLEKEKAENMRLQEHLEAAREKLKRQNKYIAELKAALEEKENEIQEAIEKGLVKAEEVKTLKEKLDSLTEDNIKLSQKLNEQTNSENLKAEIEEVANMPATTDPPNSQQDNIPNIPIVNVSDALSKILQGASKTGKLAKN